MNKPQPDTILILCLRLGAFFCFAGWTWVHFYWESPLGILLWQDSTFVFAEKLGINWDEFVGTGADDGFVQKWLGRIGWLFLAGAILTLTVRHRSWIQMGGLVLGSVFLGFVAYAKFVAAGRQLPMFVEYGGQMLSPVVLVLALALGVRHHVTVNTAIVAFIMTFAGHGCYALGLWPTPANFYAMTTVILGFEFEAARFFLRTAGVLDMVVCIGVFIPVARRPCALYAVAWGLLTAIARPIAGMSSDLNYWGADQFLHEAVVRAPHFLIPLYLFVLWHWPRSAETLALEAESVPDSADAVATGPVDRVADPNATN